MFVLFLLKTIRFNLILYTVNYEDIALKKQQLDKHRPLPMELVSNLDDWFRIELTYNSNAIEGNTLTRQETALIVEKGLTVGGKTLVEHLEANNHAEALDWVMQQVKRKPQDLTEKDILHIHHILLKGIDDENAGHYRNVRVRISGSQVVLPNPLKISQLMQQFINFLQNSAELNPIEIAAEAHYQLVSIHPFSDGNGRTARLLMNLILLMEGYPLAIIRKIDRLSYIKTLEQAQLGGAKKDYTDLMTKAVNRSLNLYLRAIDKKITGHDTPIHLLKIGELAKQANVTPTSIRHWTKEQLIDIAEMTDSGYTLYSSVMIDRIKKIRALKRERYTLKEIKKQLDV